jgi:hypothetical protein
MSGKEHRHVHSLHRGSNSKSIPCLDGVRRVCIAINDVCLTAGGARGVSVTTEAHCCLTPLRPTTYRRKVKLKPSAGYNRACIVQSRRGKRRLSSLSRTICAGCSVDESWGTLHNVRVHFQNVEFRSNSVLHSYSKIRKGTRWSDTRLLLVDPTPRLQIPVVAWNWQMRYRRIPRQSNTVRVALSFVLMASLPFASLNIADAGRSHHHSI